jgi:uncharacterized protein (DUF1697 family)
MFLTNLPKPGAVKSLDPGRSPPNRFIVRGKEVYLLFPEGFARTKLTSSYFDSKLGTIGTVRSWRTVTKLLELMEGHLTPRSARNSSRSDTGGRKGGR